MPAPPTDADLLTPADAARILGLSVDMVRVLATEGQLPTAATTARGARLFRRDDVEELAEVRAGRPVRHHSVQFYESDEHLAAVVAAFLGDRVRKGAPAIIIATKPHRTQIVEQLEARDIAAAAAVRAGQIQLLDAHETLAAFMVGGAPDEALFRAHVGEVVVRLKEAWPRGQLRAYGEMVDLLWKDGLRQAALDLEEMWNRLAQVRPFSLLCGYAMSNFGTSADAAPFEQVCSTHTRVVPCESFHADGTIEQRHREIARLQQRARALESELSARQRTEEALRQAKDDLDRYSGQLVEALRAKETILAVLGHELRNPLAPILTAVELMRARGQESREHAVIARQVRHLHRIVDDLVDIGRLLNGPVELERRPVPVAAVVNRAVEVAGSALHERRADLEIELPPDDAVAEVDLDRVAQALANLLRNAAANSPAGTTIRVHARVDASSVVISVVDQGAGIPAHLLPHLFEPFVQHPQPLDRPAGGLGLGLAITKNVVALHGGRVEARSDGPGKGSEFVVVLPLRAANAEDSSVTADPAFGVAARSRRILIVDDNVDWATSLGELLSAVGHVVEVAHGAESALLAAGTFRPEIGIVDIGLPGIDGHELARRLAERHAGLRLLAMSGYGDGATKARSAAAGFEAHLVKPVRIGDLLWLLEGP